MLIDAHTHVASPDFERYPLCPDAKPNGWYHLPDIGASGLSEQLDSAEVDYVVLVQAMSAYAEDNRYVLACGAELGRRAAVVASIASTSVGIESLAELATNSLVGGIRIVAQDPRFFPDGPISPEPEAWKPLWSALAEVGLPVFITVWPVHVPEMVEVVNQYPDLPIILDHAAFLSPDALAAGAQELREMREHRSLYVKVATSNLLIAEQAGVAPSEVVNAMVDSIGSNRILWGSDWPNSRPEGGYPRALAIAIEACSGISTADKDNYLGGTATTFFPQFA